MWDIINKISSICGIIGFLISICSIFFNIFIIKILNSQKMNIIKTAIYITKSCNPFSIAFMKTKLSHPKFVTH